jgi:hypothetical protein
MSLDRIHPHAPAHVFEMTDQLPPESGIRRMYVDADTGSDLAAGVSWLTAWKTLAKAETSALALLFLEPNGLDIRVFVRGAFSTESIRLAACVAGTSGIHLIHAVDDMEEISTGTVNTVAATVYGHGMRELTFNAPWVPGAADVGRWLIFSLGTDKVAFQVLRVLGTKVTVNAGAGFGGLPAWIVGGGTVSVSVRDPTTTVTGISNIDLAIQYAQTWDGAFKSYRNTVFGLACDILTVVDTQGWVLAVKASNYIRLAKTHYVDTAVGDLRYSTAAFLQEIGVLGTNVTDDARVGCWSTGSLATTVAASTDYLISGVFSSEITASVNSAGTIRYCSAPTFIAQIAGMVFANTIVTGGSLSSYPEIGVSADYGSVVRLSATSFLDLPATGLTTAMIRVLMGGWCSITSSVDGSNTGNGAGLYAIQVTKGGRLQCESGPSDTLKGDDGIIRCIDGTVEFGANILWGAKQGDGPDMYFEGSTVYFGGDFRKTARNNAPSAVLVAVSSRISQLAASLFYVATPPSANWATDYGAYGVIYLHENVALRLGDFAGGTSGAETGIGCTVKNASSFIHRGNGLLGVNPLDLGGLPAAIAWPAAARNDQGAVVPQNCIVIPNVA